MEYDVPRHKQTDSTDTVKQEALKAKLKEGDLVNFVAWGVPRQVRRSSRTKLQDALFPSPWTQTHTHTH